jgi:repressor LexA
MSTELTVKQRAIYDFVVECVHVEGIPPSLTEIAAAFDLVSVSGVADHLRALERKGFIRRRRGVSRGIELVDVSRRRSAPDPAVEVPVIGSLPARKRLELDARDSGRHLILDGRMAKRGAVAVRVNLNGLETRGILRGDYLIVVNGAAPRAGELALAQLRTTTALVEVLPESRVWRIDDDVELHGSFEFLGKVVAVMRFLGEATRKT